MFSLTLFLKLVYTLRRLVCIRMHIAVSLCVHILHMYKMKIMVISQKTIHYKQNMSRLEGEFY